MRLERPILCLVTDRRRLTGGDETFETAGLVALVSELVAIARGSTTRIIVNDRVDVALACGANGVHLRSDSIAPAAARSIAPPGFLVGRSVHELAEAVEHAPAVDYLIAGTVFPTLSKPAADRLLGESGLRRIAAAVRVPVLAIGGVTVELVPAIAASGASGVAGIGLFLPSAMSMRTAAAAVRAKFDRVGTAS